MTSSVLDETDEVSILKSRIRVLEREIEVLRAKFLGLHEIREMVKEVVSVTEFRESLKADLPELFKNERWQACEEIYNTLEKSSQELIDEVRKTRTFTQVTAAPALRPPSQAGTRPPPNLNPEGFLLIQPKEDIVRKYEENYKLFMGIVKNSIPEARIKGTGSLGGVE